MVGFSTVDYEIICGQVSRLLSELRGAYSERRVLHDAELLHVIGMVEELSGAVERYAVKKGGAE